MAPTIATPTLLRTGAVLSVLSLCIFAGGCAQLGTPSLASLTSDGSKTAAGGANSATPQGGLAAATAYWGKEFSKNPTKLEPAMAYAKNLKAMGRKKQALAVLQQAAVYHGDKQELAGEYGRLALDLGQVKIAEKVLAQADNPAQPDWRIISARGTVLAKQGRYKDSIPFYQRAMALAPEHPSLLNNLAMAHAMGGDPVKAEEMLRLAVSKGGDSKRVRQNLALVLGLQGRYDESAKVGSKDIPIQSAAADTAQLRKLVKLDPVQAPINSGGTQMATVPGLKGTNADNSSAGGWGTKVAAARK